MYVLRTKYVRSNVIDVVALDTVNHKVLWSQEMVYKGRNTSDD